MPEQRVVLRNCGWVDPSDIHSYLKRDGLAALKKARDQSPQTLIDQVKRSSLRGRGGAGFPTGMKWEFAARSPGGQRYVVCNADEGEVGTFKDRYILQHDPFGLFEGIAIACYAIGAAKAYLYLRAEYHYLRAGLDIALVQAQQAGLGCDIEIREGAGAYVCGEESALIESIESKRGEIRYRPPFPPNHGLWQDPTVINNVETLMNIPPIVLNGPDWYTGIGTGQCPGTKVFSVSGDVARPGVYELPMGSTLRELVEELAQAQGVKAVQVGGASGRVLPAGRLDTPLGFETVLGAGAVMVFNNTRGMVELARENIQFFCEESCGKCVPCREGNPVLLHLLSKLENRKATQSDLATMKELSEVMTIASLCGLGQAAPNSLLDTMAHWENEYLELIAATPGTG